MLAVSSIAQRGSGPVPGLPFLSLPCGIQPTSVRLPNAAAQYGRPDYRTRTLGSSTSLPPI